MGTRLDLHSLLKDILGSNNVYFQPPASVKMSYPAIVYSRGRDNVKFADSNPYRIVRQYELIVIDRNPDTIIPDKLANLPMCTLNRCYTSDNLYHYAFNIYY